MKRFIEIESCWECTFQKCIDNFSSHYFKCPEGETSEVYSYKDSKRIAEEQKAMFENCKTLPKVEE